MSYNGPLPQVVVAGGTGTNSLTAHALLVGNGSLSVQLVGVGASGTVLTGTGSDPAFSSTPLVSSLRLPGNSASNILTIQASSSTQVASRTLTLTASSNSNVIFANDVSFTGGSALTLTTIGTTTAQFPSGSYILAAQSQPNSFSTITFDNGGTIRSSQSAANTYTITAYDVDDSTNRVFATATANNTPSFAWSQPTGSTLTWDGGAIGSTTAATGKFTTLTETTSMVYSVASTAASVTQSTTYLGVTDNSSARTITLATADVGVAGTIRIIKDEAGTAGSSNNITIVGQAAQTIDGAASLLITANYGCARLISRNSKWWTF